MTLVIAMHFPKARSKLSKSSMHLSTHSALKTSMILPPLLLLIFSTLVCTEQEFAFFNSSSSPITIPNTVWDFSTTKELTFWTCSVSGNIILLNGSLISNSTSPSTPVTSPSTSVSSPSTSVSSPSTSVSSPSTSVSSPSTSIPSSDSQQLALILHNSSVLFSWSIKGKNGSVQISNGISSRKYYTVMLTFSLGSLRLQVYQASNFIGSVEVANRTYNSDLLHLRLFGNLTIGEGFFGCLYQGPGLNFTSAGYIPTNITRDTCPLSLGCLRGQNTAGCKAAPCQNGATCMDGVSNYTCLCPRNFNGTNCENDLAATYGCDVQPCMNQGSCEVLTGNTSKSFRCHCAVGYTGHTCETTIDLCRRNPCQQGTCISGVNSYTCNCTDTGFTGADCSVDIDECSNSSVCGGYPCSNRPGGFTCRCPPGYDGVSCKELNECLSSPCEHGGTCSDGVNNFTCACVPGYTGVMCEVNIDDCWNNPCTLPNMTCVDYVNHYECTCIEGFSGNPCRDTDECILNFCRNNATCANTPGSYTCGCLPGFTGKNCSSVIHYCEPNPCLNNATCSVNVNGYNCSCPAGYNGRHCEVDIDDCRNHHCENQATCEKQVNGYRCVCQPGWTGTYCQDDVDECESNPCHHSGSCHNNLHSYNCTCVSGFEGTNCELNIDDCKGVHCYNGGTCLDTVNDYRCNCTSAWMGKNCNEMYNACTPNPCLHGACDSEPPEHNYTCTCLPGFTGVDCKDNIDDCINHTCLPPQQCYDGIGNYTCGCPKGLAGVDCKSKINECDNNPCQHGGTCIQGDGNYTCSCNQTYLNLTALYGSSGLLLSGYNGTNCEHDINECDYENPSICQGGGLCQNNPGGFTCFCRNAPPHLGLGTFCETSSSYCDILPLNKQCKNGGTCYNLLVGSRCSCASGFTGLQCEEDINECLPQPCQNNGSCTDQVNGYLCSCVDGINGTNCENNIDDCSPNPCQNQGICQDFINNFTCDCSNTGFNGTTCEINFDDCVNSQCLNGGTCLDGINNYTCNCLPGYTGSRCEQDIPECSPNPCAHGSQCLEKSNSSLYDKGDLRFVNFTYEKAAGYLCVCVSGVEGPNCTEDINECLSNPCQQNSTCINIDKDGFKCDCTPGYNGTLCEEEINECLVYAPCKNGGTCMDKVADYVCTCPAPVASRTNYGGKNCTTFLRGCEGPRRCWNGNCIPKLVNETLDLHSFDCDCHAGYTGQFCAQSTDISFRSNHSDYIKTQINSSSINLSLRFQTTVATGVLVLWKMSVTSFVSVELSGGKVLLRYKEAIGSWACPINTLFPVNNSAYHQLNLTISQNITLSLPGSNCTGVGCSSRACLASFSFGGTQPPASSQLYIGSGSVAQVEDSTMPSGFVGCMEDVLINEQLYYPGKPNGQYLVSPGCSRIPQCVEDSCSRHGFCEDLWDSYVCNCYRPYYGINCQNEYESATYGKHPGTFATYNLFGGIDDWALSFFLITKQQDGFILYMGNDDPDFAKKRSFIGLYISGTNLSGDFFKCGYGKRFNTARQVSDGLKHFIEVEVMATTVRVKVDTGLVYEDRSVPPSETVCSSGYGFLVSLVNIGQGLSASSSIRRRRFANFLDGDFFRNPGWSFRRWKRQAISGQDLVSSYQNMSGLEGVIQDVQVNKFKLSYNNTDFTTPRNYNVTLGEHSTATVCQSGLCENDGNCTEVFYNDFICKCPKGFMGKNCSMIDYCAHSTCPSESTCQNLDIGYECGSTASFISDNSIVTYIVSGTTPQPVLTFQFRTRGLFGLIFLLRQGDYFFKVRVANGKLEMNWKLSSDFSKSSVTKFGRRVDDGQWHGGKFEVINGTQIRLQVLQDAVVLDETEVVDLSAANFNFEEMLRDGEIILGSSGRQKSSFQWEAGFRGCLREVRMGGQLMPFFRDETFKNNNASNKFLAQRVESIVHNCDGANSCAGHSCLNGGSCSDLWNDYKCVCPAGLEGQLCEDNPDNCASGPCLNGGVCVDGLATFTCTCPRGFSGSVCQSELDPCAANSSPLCANNSICEKYSSDYKCNCTDLEFTGWYCNVSVHQNCSSSGVSCQNGGSCSNRVITVGNDTNVTSFKCSCPAGYEGPLCEKAIDYCSINGSVCENGGQCVNKPENQSFQCNCSQTLGYTGLNCSIKIDSCTENKVNCNNGTCVAGFNDSTCLCNTGYTGPRCEVRLDECQNKSLCQRGECELETCNCTGSGWQDDHCRSDIDECNSTEPACLHGGTCTNLEGSFHCNCTLGYQGDRCERANCTDICENGGSCLTNSTANITDWSCLCPTYVEGVQCEVIGPCFLQPCQQNNTLSCTQSIQFNNYTCSCREGWRGANCTEDIDECEENTDGCVNGTCSNNNGSYTCDCQLGFTGRFCDANIDECQPKPCEHEGVCVDGIGNYTCRCDGTGYDGPTCSNNIDECSLNQTLCRLGICKDLPGSYECNCTDKYLGSHCESDNPCYNSTICQNDGKCQSNLTQNGTYVPSCLCLAGFDGATCEKSYRGSKSPDLGVIIGPIVGGVVLIILIIVLIAFVMTARSKRATRGAYSPSQQETSGSRVELDNVLKKPPEERLI